MCAAAEPARTALSGGPRAGGNPARRRGTLKREGGTLA